MKLIQKYLLTIIYICMLVSLLWLLIFVSSYVLANVSQLNSEKGVDLAALSTIQNSLDSLENVSEAAVMENCRFFASEEHIGIPYFTDVNVLYSEFEDTTYVTLIFLGGLNDEEGIVYTPNYEHNDHVLVRTEGKTIHGIYREVGFGNKVLITNHSTVALGEEYTVLGKVLFRRE